MIPIAIEDLASLPSSQTNRLPLKKSLYHLRLPTKTQKTQKKRKIGKKVERKKNIKRKRSIKRKEMKTRKKKQIVSPSPRPNPLPSEEVGEELMSTMDGEMMTLLRMTKSQVPNPILVRMLSVLNPLSVRSLPHIFCGPYTSLPLHAGDNSNAGGDLFGDSNQKGDDLFASGGDDLFGSAPSKNVPSSANADIFASSANDDLFSSSPPESTANNTKQPPPSSGASPGMDDDLFGSSAPVGGAIDDPFAGVANPSEAPKKAKVEPPKAEENSDAFSGGDFDFDAPGASAGVGGVDDDDDEFDDGFQPEFPDMDFDAPLTSSKASVGKGSEKEKEKPKEKEKGKEEVQEVGIVDNPFDFGGDAQTDEATNNSTIDADNPFAAMFAEDGGGKEEVGDDIFGGGGGDDLFG